MSNAFHRQHWELTRRRFRLSHLLAVITLAAIGAWSFLPPRTVIVSPRVVDVGAITPGRSAAGVFTVHNRGVEPLQVLLRPRHQLPHERLYRIVQPGERSVLRVEQHLRQYLRQDSRSFRLAYELQTDRWGEHVIPLEIRGSVGQAPAKSAQME